MKNPFIFFADCLHIFQKYLNKELLVFEYCHKCREGKISVCVDEGEPGDIYSMSPAREPTYENQVCHTCFGNGYLSKKYYLRRDLVLGNQPFRVEKCPEVNSALLEDNKYWQNKWEMDREDQIKQAAKCFRAIQAEKAQWEKDHPILTKIKKYISTFFNRRANVYFEEVICNVICFICLLVLFSTPIWFILIIIIKGL